MPNYRYQPSDGMCRTRMVCKEPCMESRIPERECKDRPLAMAYVPWQNWQAVYEVTKGFSRGTIFAELDKPFEGTGGRLR